MSTYLVTGGAGFIGSHLVNRLLAAGHHVRVLDDLSTGRRENLSDRAELIIGCVSDPGTVAAALDGVDGCFHLAAIASVARCNDDWLTAHRVNLGGGINVFEGASRQRPTALPVVYASSAAIYGDTDTLPITEDTIPRPQTPYGADKVGLEHQARAHAAVRGLSSVGLRFFNVYGPRQDPSSPYSGVIARFTDLLAAGRPVSVHGDGRQTRDFVYVSDVVEACLSAMNRIEARPGAEPRAEIFNVCTGHAVSILDLASTLGRLLHRDVSIAHTAPRAGDIRQSYGDPRALEAAFGLRPQVPLAVGLQRLLEWNGTLSDLRDTIHTRVARQTS